MACILKLQFNKIILLGRLNLSIFIVAILAAFSGVNASATTYYVRADGLASGKDQATGPVTNRFQSMNLSVLNSSIFSPADVVYFSSRGGEFTSRFTIPSSGNASNDVTYEGIVGEVPLINVSRNSNSSAGIVVVNKDFITIRNFEVRGSGGISAFSVWGDSGISGYGVKVHDVNVLSAYGASSGSNDCFSVNNISEVVFYDISASGCREASPPYVNSHQAITGHTSSKYHVLGGVFTDSNYVAVNTLNTVGRLENIYASEIHRNFFDIGSDGTSNSSITVTNSILNVNLGSGLAAISSQNSRISIKESIINVSKSRHQFVQGGILEYLNNDIYINDENWRLQAYGGDILLKGNEIRINDVNGFFVTNSSSTNGDIIVKGNSFVAGDSFEDYLFFFRNSTNAGRLSYNTFTGFDAEKGVVRVYLSSKAPIINNNTIFNFTQSGRFINLEHSGTENSDQELLLFNNIFSGVSKIISAKANVSYEASYNIYHNSQNLYGVGSINLDPQFVTPGSDFHLLNTSPAINAGTDTYSLGLPTDLIILGAPDIGAREFASNEILCGEPLYEKQIEKGYFIWKDCLNDSIHIRVTGGGDPAGVNYAGSLAFVSPVTSNDISTFSFESSDSLFYSSQNKVDYLMKVWNGGEDGLDISYQQNICFLAPNSIAPIYFGASKQLITAPFNLDTLQSCNIKPPITECGEPDYDLNTETAQYIWKDCSTGEWNIKASAGVHFGTVTSLSGFTTLLTASFENSDKLDSTVNGFTYEMRVGSPWWDQISFLPENESSTCFDASGSSLPVYFGKNRREINTLNLATLTDC